MNWFVSIVLAAACVVVFWHGPRIGGGIIEFKAWLKQIEDHWLGR